jgi:uncharacterized protein (DUF2225 family)
LNNQDYPEKANDFLCWSIINENNNEYAEAGWACVHAAWICDDEGFKEKAVECREQAAALFQKASDNNQEFAYTEEDGIILLADLLRRSGQFDKGKTLVRIALKSKLGDPYDKLLSFEKELIEKKDTNCHSIGEILGEE